MITALIPLFSYKKGDSYPACSGFPSPEFTYYFDRYKFCNKVLRLELQRVVGSPSAYDQDGNDTSFVIMFFFPLIPFLPLLTAPPLGVGNINTIRELLGN